MNYKRLTNALIGLINFANKKIANSELADYAVKVKLVSNHGHHTDLDIIVDNIIEFSHKNRAAIKSRSLTGFVHDKFDVMHHIDLHKHLFSEAETEDMWKRVHEIINISIDICSARSN